MRASDIVYCSLLGLCNYVILREVLTYGLARTLAQGFANPRIRVAVFLGLLFTVGGGIAHRTADFNPDMNSVLNWSLVFLIPFALALITKGKLDPGWDSLEKGKAIWKSLYPRVTYRDGVVNEGNAALRDDPRIIQAKALIRQSVDLAPQSNVQGDRAVANAAIALQELGLLHRVLNEFDEAEAAFKRSLELLDQDGGGESTHRNTIAAFRDTSFRLGELCHVTSRPTEAKAYYQRSLSADEQLGHDDPGGEEATKSLLRELERQA